MQLKSVLLALALGLLVSVLSVAPFIQATVPSPIVTPDNLVLLNTDGSVNFTTVYCSTIDELTAGGGVKMLKLVVENGSSFPASPVDKQVFWRNDLNTLYLYNGSSWTSVGSGTYPSSYPYGNVTGTPDMSVVLVQNATRTLLANWNAGNSGVYGIYGLSYVVATTVYTDEIDNRTVAGYVRVKRLVIDASASAPLAPATGQMYFDTTQNQPYIYNGTSWIVIGNSTSTGSGNLTSVTQPASYIISTDGGGGYYSYYGTNSSIAEYSTNASQVINDALHNLTWPMGNILMNPGIYSLTAPILFDNTMGGAKLQGSGPSTILSFNVAGHYCIERLGTAGTVTNIQLSDFQIDLYANALGGIHLEQSCFYWTIFHVLIQRDWSVDADNGQVGVLFDGTGSGCYWNRIESCDIYKLGYGIYMNNSANSNYIINPNIMQGWRAGIYINSGMDTQSSNVRMESPNALTGIVINDDYNTVGPLYMEFSNISSLGVNFTVNSDSNRILGGRFTVYGPYYVNSGRQNRFEYVTNLVTESTGTWSGTSPVYIANPLNGTPTGVTVCVNAVQPYAVAYSVNATYITIYHNGAGSLSGSYYCWYNP